jgi:uncharacterized protein YjiS (DUF1127 family)
MTQTLKSFLQKLINDYQMAKAIRQTEHELRKLTDAELNDIGIARGDIYSIARQDVDMKQSHLISPFNPNLKGFV